VVSQLAVCSLGIHACWIIAEEFLRNAERQPGYVIVLLKIMTEVHLHLTDRLVDVPLTGRAVLVCHAPAHMLIPAVLYQQSISMNARHQSAVTFKNFVKRSWPNLDDPTLVCGIPVYLLSAFLPLSSYHAITHRLLPPVGCW